MTHPSAPLPDEELAAIEARQAAWLAIEPVSDVRDMWTTEHLRSAYFDVSRDRDLLLAALRAERDARARVEAAARDAVDAIGFYEFDGETRLSFPVDRDGVSEREQEAPFIALRAALAPATRLAEQDR